MTSTRRVLRLVQGLGLATVAVALSVLAAEIGVRFFLPQPLLHDPDAFLPDPVLGARLRPGFEDRVVTTEFSSTWRINDDGHRGPRAGERGTVDRRLLALGDSFTFGYGVEETEAWPRRLEQALHDVTRDRVEVLNLGVGGYGTWEEALYLDRERTRLDPDLVLIAFYVGNDPSDNRRRSRTTSDGTPQRAGPPGPGRLERAKRWLGARSHLYNLISVRGDDLLVRVGARRLVYPFEMDILLEDEPPDVTAAWEATEQALATLAGVCTTLPRCLVVIVPMKHQVDQAVYDRLLAYFADRGADPGGFDLDRPQRRLVTLLDEAGLESFDLLPILRSASATGGPLYWQRDQHWNQSGHAAAARALAERLTREPAPDRGEPGQGDLTGMTTAPRPSSPR